MELRTHPMFVNLRKQVIGGKKQKKNRKVNREKMENERSWRGGDNSGLRYTGDRY